MISNFSPRIISQKDKFNKKIFLKNFFLVMILLKNNSQVKKISIFIKPNQNRSLVILRAPYRYKLAKLQITLRRYNIWIFLKLNSTPNILKFSDFKKNINFYKLLPSKFESVFLHQHKSVSQQKVYNTSNFFLKNF